MLMAIAVIDRLKRCLSDGAEELMRALQPPALALGPRLKVDVADSAMVGEAAVRGSTAAPLAQLLGILEPVLRRATGAGDWQVISRGSEQAVVGRLRVETAIGAMQYETCAEPTVLVVQQLTGHEEIPEGAVAVLVAGNCPDVLSHSAVRARNLGVLLAGCYNSAVSNDICALAGQEVAVSVSGQNVVVKLHA